MVVVASIPFLLVTRGCAELGEELRRPYVDFGVPRSIAGTDPSSQRVYHVLMSNLLAANKLAGPEIGYAKHETDLFFAGLDAIDPYGALRGSLRTRLLTAKSINQKIHAKIAATSQGAFDAAVDRVRSRYPDWIEDKRLYLAWCDREAEAADVTPERKLLAAGVAKRMKTNWPYANHDRLAWRTRSSDAVAKMVQEAVAEMRAMSPTEADNLLVAAIKRHPRWKGLPWQHLASVLELLESGQLPEHLKWEAVVFLEGHLWSRLPHQRPTGWRMNLDARDQLMKQANRKLLSQSFESRKQSVAEMTDRFPRARLHSRWDYVDDRPTIDEQLQILDDRAFYGPKRNRSLPADTVGFCTSLAILFFTAGPGPVRFSHRSRRKTTMS